MIRIIATVLLLSTFGWADAGEPKYPVSQISDELKTNANAVIRKNEIVYQIISKSKAKVYHHLVITVLNPRGKHFGTETVGYTRLSKITNFDALAYDGEGNVIRKLRNKDIVDQSAYDGFSLYHDYRLKHVDLTQSAYPYTVEFEYEQEYDYLYGIEGAYILPDENVSLEHLSYTLIFPKDLAPRYKTLNLDVKPVETRTEQGLESIQWVVNNLKPVTVEPLGPSLSELVPRILAAPSLFEYSGYFGDMSTWNEYGKWYLTLNAGRDVLPPAAKAKVAELTKGLSTVEEKARVLYEYLQGKTRYVNIALGIGALQPFEATVVDQVGYGDCKALSNYMVAMLKEAGINGYYCTIYGGRKAPRVLEDFPSHQANHIIVAVPNQADTLWLECTSQTNPFGYLGSFTGNRKALMITENGGVLVKTPSYTADQNTLSRAATVEIDDQGNARAVVNTTYRGLQYDEGGLAHYVSRNFDEQKEWVLENTEIPTFDVRSFSMVNRKEILPEAVVKLDLALNRFASLSGKRMFFTPNLMNRNTFIPEKLATRKTPVYRDMAYTDYDTITYKVPEGIYPEFLPEPIKIKTRFGEYEASFTADQGSLVYTRKLKMYDGEFPPESYGELVEFFRNINRADNTKLVFMSRT